MEEEEPLLGRGSVIRDQVGGSYVIERVLGKGGMSVVYLVRAQDNKGGVFALKEEINPDGYRRAGFTFEANLLRRLRHRALPRVYQVFEDVPRHRLYMLMQYVDGQNLDALRREQPERRFPLSLALEVLEPVVDALIYLHQQKPPIVHLDVKPSNIVVSSSTGKAVLVDFGIAKEYVEDKTTAVIRQASSGYSAPEQYSGGTTPRADLYSLGATFYALLTGEIPSNALNRAIYSQETDPLQPVHSIVPAIPEGVAQAIARAMTIQSEGRFETVEEFWEEMKRYAPQEDEESAHWLSLSVPGGSESIHEETTQPPAPPGRRGPRLRGRQVALLVLALLALVGVGGAGVVLAMSRSLGAAGAVQRSTATPAFAGCPKSAASPVSTPSASAAYPSLAPSYAGTIYDYVDKEKTALCLTNIQQDQGTFQGTFQGLGVVGSFQGTITADNQLAFTVPLYSGTEVMVCKGTFRLGGDIRGTFQVYNQQGNFLGDFGDWNASADTR
jgi:serine/threonine protein kinase